MDKFVNDFFRSFIISYTCVLHVLQTFLSSSGNLTNKFWLFFNTKNCFYDKRKGT